jgi:Zn-dependent peptidase ImmA (M78 family)
MCGWVNRFAGKYLPDYKVVCEIGDNVMVKYSRSGKFATVSSNGSLGDPSLDAAAAAHEIGHIMGHELIALHGKSKVLNKTNSANEVIADSIAIGILIEERVARTSSEAVQLLRRAKSVYGGTYE